MSRPAVGSAWRASRAFWIVSLVSLITVGLSSGALWAKQVSTPRSAEKAPAVPLIKPPPHPFPSGPGTEDIADVPVEDLRAGGDPDMRYGLIGPVGKDAAAPPGGYKLLLFLPGGDGSADFNPFLRRIVKNALPSGYLAAQLVAPVWRADQPDRVVWPTSRSRVEGMRFTTEEFIAAVIRDVEKRRKIDPKHVFALGWSSGGPPVYAAALTDGSPLAGAFVAMSIFQPATLPPLTGAKGKAFYLLHSPEDFIPIEQAENARGKLAAAGAKTILVTYPGGHGWRSDPFGNISRGVQWLDKSAAP